MRRPVIAHLLTALYFSGAQVTGMVIPRVPVKVLRSRKGY